MKTGWKQLGVLLLATFFVGTAQAIPITDLFGGESIIAGDKQFSGWVLIFSDATHTIDLTQIEVTGLADGGLDPGPGLHFEFGDAFTFDGAFDPEGILAFADVMFGFWVTVLDPGLLIKDVSMSTGGFISAGENGNDGWLVLENVFDDVPFGALLGSLEAEFSWLDPDIFGDGDGGSTDFAGLGSIWVEINIFAFAELVTDLVGLESMDLRFSQEAVGVPEPGTLALLGLGLLGMAGSRRRKRTI